MQQNKMLPQGIKMVEYAKETGTWDALDKVNALVIPKEMKQLFKTNKQAASNFEKFPPSTKRSILEWIYNAKQDATRLNRITETVNLAAENKRALQYQPKK